jgi:3-hydroxyacyl-CoA dehydrogenase/enoyl-CoA hydratase/3-hydroxybutyryl-CoA epimerase
MKTHWQVETDSQGILWLGLDYAGGPANLLGSEVLRELEQRLDEIEAAPPKALVLHSLKRNFIAGADLNEIEGVTDAGLLKQQIQSVHRIFDRVEALPCPSVALINGYCLGGGLELALACRYRVAVDDDDARIGLPEVRLGIFPGYGGTWRSIRNLGPLPALRLMLTGRALRPRDAKRVGLVDMVVPRRQLPAAARHILEQGPPPRRAGRLQRLPSSPVLRPLAAGALRRETAKKADPEHYPAPFRLIEHWRAHGDDGPALLASEAHEVSRLLTGDTALNLIRLFKLRERLKGLGRGKAHHIGHVHVIGAGVMGGDIAAWAALSGFRVTLQDLALDQLARAMKRAHGLFRKRLEDPRKVRDAWDRLTPDPRGDGLGRADLVLEAIVEDADAKRQLFAGIEPRLHADALLATNTSSIPLEVLGDGLRRPERLLGLHFFNPVARMELVEVVRGQGSAAAAIDRAVAFVHGIGRLPLPVQSSPGFLVNRILMPYLLEAVELLQEGLPAPAVDRAAEAFGMPMGPIALADSVGLDICLAVAEEIGPRLSIPTSTPELLRERVHQGALGKKTGEGFYHYRRGKRVSRGNARVRRSPPDLAERMIFRLLNESVACLREGIVDDADLLDAGVVFGTGFAPFRGGPMHFIAEGGQARMLSRLRDLEASHGSHFHPDRGWSALQV